MIGVLFLFFTACNDKPECEEVAFEGTPFFEMEGANGGFSGNVTWSSTIENGLVLEFGYETADGLIYMGAVGDNLFDQPKTCGNSIAYTISGVESGEYTVLVRIQESISGSDTGETVYLAEGRSDLVTLEGSVVSGVDVELEEIP